MSAAGRWFVTPHAVRRYVERCRPRLDYESALAELIEQSHGAHFVRHQSNGDLWRGPRPWRFRFVVGHADGGLAPLLTVLGPFDGWRP